MFALDTFLRTAKNHQLCRLSDKAACDHEAGVVIAVFATEDGHFRYAVDMEGYGALQFFAEEKLVVHTS
jgi:hypothetical protein